MSADWSTHLCCNCLENCGAFCNACLCPCIAHGKTVENSGDGSCFPQCCLFIICAPFACCLGAWRREQIRKKRNIGGSYCADCLTNAFCFPCAIVQETEELDKNPVAEQPGRIHPMSTK